MSTTNRAFIRAYRHDTAQKGVGGELRLAPESAPATRAMAGVATTDRVVRGSPDPAQLATEGLNVAGEGRPAVSRSAGSGDPRTTVGEPRMTAQTVERRPLSSFIPRTQPITEVVDTPREDARTETFRPGTVVASFSWPAVCRTLLQQSGPQLDHVIRIMQTRTKAGNSLIGVLGLFPGIGATTTALCLASRAAGRGPRVILTDCNFSNPRLGSLLDAVPTAGWEEVLRHAAPLADAVIRATSDRLDLLVLGKRPAKEPQPLAGGLQAAMTAGVLRHNYDLAIMDLGAFFDPPSQPTLIELVSNMGLDAAVAVAGPEPADPRDLGTITEHLGRSGCEFLGVIENRSVKF